MQKKHKRNLIFNVNKYQQQILYPVLLACSFACILMLFCFIFLLAQISNANHIGPIRISVLQFYIPWIMILAAYIILFVIYWTYHTTNKMVGPYERVIKELDEVVEGKRKGPINARPGDDLFNELLKRINALIDKLPKQ